MYHLISNQRFRKSIGTKAVLLGTLCMLAHLHLHSAPNFNIKKNCLEVRHKL